MTLLNNKQIENISKMFYDLLAECQARQMINDEEARAIMEFVEEGQSYRRGFKAIVEAEAILK